MFLLDSLKLARNNYSDFIGNFFKNLKICLFHTNLMSARKLSFLSGVSVLASTNPPLSQCPLATQHVSAAFWPLSVWEPCHLSPGLPEASQWRWGLKVPSHESQSSKRHEGQRDDSRMQFVQKWKLVTLFILHHILKTPSFRLLEGKAISIYYGAGWILWGIQRISKVRKNGWKCHFSLYRLFLELRPYGLNQLLQKLLYFFGGNVWLGMAHLAGLHDSVLSSGLWWCWEEPFVVWGLNPKWLGCMKVKFLIPCTISGQFQRFFYSFMNFNYFDVL